MPQPRTISLTAAEETTLVEARDHHPVPYSRERAAAVLQVASGWSVRRVASDGLLRPRRRESVGDWVDRYQELGVVALAIRPGRGRKSAYARAGLSPEQAAEAVLDQVHRSPRAAGVDRSRWSLVTLLTTVLRLKGLTFSGLSRLLGRLDVRYRRGQEHLHSPDPEDDAKMTAIAAARAEAAARPGAVVSVYQDEFTAYRRPSVAQAWHEAGGPGPPAKLGQKANNERRLIGSLDAIDGRVFCWQRAHADVGTLVRYYQALAEAYLSAEKIYVARDNWPVHFHPHLVESLRATKIHLLRLPTYAPWTNPIEEVWRRLKQELLHQHDYGDNWEALKCAISTWLQNWAGPSPGMLRYVGLCPG